MSTSVVEIIQHYQRSIEKCHNDEGRLLHCIKKLYKLPVKIEHLQETGIGKTVNSLRKLNGETGVAAKALVTKWKTMVAAEEETVEPVNQMNYYNSNPTNDGGGGGGDGEVGGSSEEDEDQIRYNKIINSNSNSNTQNQETLKMQPAQDFIVSSTQQRQQQQQQQNQLQQNEREHHKTHKEKSNSGHHKNHKESSSSSHQKSSSNHHNHNQQQHSQTIATENKHHKNRDSSSKEQHHKSGSSSHHHHYKEKEQNNAALSSSNSNLKSINDEKKQQILTKERPNHKHEKDISSRDKEKHKEKYLKESGDKQYTAKSSSKHRDHQNGDRKKSKDHKSHSKDKEKQHKSNNIISNNSPKPSTSNTTLTTAATTPNDELRKQRIANSSESSDHTDAAVVKASQSQMQKTKEKISTKRKHANDDDDHDGIDSTMGANFADVLGMLNMPKKKTKKTLSTLISPQSTNNNNGSGNVNETSSSSKKTNNSSNNHKEKDNSEKSNSILNGVKQSPPQPELLSSNVKLEPLDPSIALDLPPISTNYKPRPLNQTVMDCVYNTNNSAASKRTLTDAEAINHGISSKTMRTKIYSGIKSGQALQVPTLFDLCIRLLQKNIDAIEFTGGVPFEVLRSVLERATPSQLQNFEEYNPYLMEDCDELWRHHVQRNYRTQKRQEMETWRDMFIRCQEEEASRLNRLAQNIRQSQKEMSAPVRKTQLAFVDTMVKPPRNIQRKQEIYGTKSKIVATPAARTTALQSVTPNATKAGDARLRVMAAFSVDNAQIGTSSSSSKTKKAPLMMKTLQFMRGRNKR